MLCILLLICYVFCYFHELFFLEYSRALKVANLSNWIIFFSSNEKVCVCWNVTYRNFLAPFCRRGSVASGLWSHYDQIVFTTKSPEIRGTQRPESALEPPSGFQHGTPELRFQRLNQEAINQQINVYFQYPKKA